MGFMAPKMAEMFKQGMAETGTSPSTTGNSDETEAKKMLRVMLAAKGMKSGGKVSSASKRADGIAVKGKTKGKMV
jgi:hypothetical protein